MNTKIRSAAIGLMFVAISAGTRAQAPKLVSITAEQIQVGRNLLDDSGFEKTWESGVPAGWSWSRRNTDAAIKMSADSHSGHQAILVTNSTEFGADVYGMLCKNQAIRLAPGTKYTLSAWTKSNNPGIAWIGGGRDWQYRLQLPATAGKWRRVSLGFTATPEDANFELRVCTESPCAAVLLDDVKLEQGNEPSPYTEEGSASPPSLSAQNADQEAEGDGPFAADFVVYAPTPEKVTAVARLGAGHTVSCPLDLQPGAWRVRVRGVSSASDDAMRPMTLTLQGGGINLSAQESLRIYSASGAARRLSALEKRLPAIKAMLVQISKSGQDISYPQISFTVLTNFVRYAGEDIRRGEVRRAIMQISDLEGMADRCARELTAAGSRSGRLKDVPRWTGSARPEVKSSAFLGPTQNLRTPGANIQRRPIFFTGYGAFGQVRADIEKFPGYGVNIIQIEIGPSAVFPKEGVLDEGPIREIKAVLDRAQKSGIAVNLLISPHYFPDWMLQKYPDLRKRREGFLAYCLHAPESQDLLKRFVAAVIPALRGSPALHSICLSNEPVNVEEACEPGAKQWRLYLEGVHKTIASLNAAWRTEYTAFDAVPMPDPYKSPPTGAVRMDYLAFNRSFFAGWHRMLAEAVHAAAPELPVHAKAMTWTMVNGAEARYGVDAAMFGAFSDINGNDSANIYEFGAGEFAQGWELNALDHDLQRSVLDAPVFNSENHIITDRDTRYVPAKHVYTALWQAAIHGQSATTIWVWERSYDPKSDTAGSVMHRPACAEAVGRVNCDLNRAALEVTALQQAPPDLLMLQSFTGSVWDAGRYTDSMSKLYAALTFMGLKTGFVTEDALAAGGDPKSHLLIIPSTTHLSAAAIVSLGRFAARPGCRLVILGDTDELTRDEYDRPVIAPQGAVRIAYRYGKTGWKELRTALTGMPAMKGVAPELSVYPADGGAEGGIEWRCVRTAGGIVIDLVNYLKTPRRVRISAPEGAIHCKDLLSGMPLPEVIELQPLEPRLCLANIRSGK